MNRRVPIRLLIWVSLAVVVGLVVRFAYSMIARNCETDHEPTGGAIDATLCTDRGGSIFPYRIGDPVDITYTLRNPSPKEIVLRPKEGTVAVDVYIQGYPERIFWSQSPSGKTIQSLTLGPGQTFTIRWRIRPADYFPPGPLYSLGIIGVWADSEDGRVNGTAVSINYGGGVTMTH